MIPEHRAIISMYIDVYAIHMYIHMYKVCVCVCVCLRIIDPRANVERDNMRERCSLPLCLSLSYMRKTIFGIQAV